MPPCHAIHGQGPGLRVSQHSLTGRVAPIALSRMLGKSACVTAIRHEAPKAISMGQVQDDGGFCAQSNEGRIAYIRFMNLIPAAQKQYGAAALRHPTGVGRRCRGCRVSRGQLSEGAGIRQRRVVRPARRSVLVELAVGQAVVDLFDEFGCQPGVVPPRGHRQQLGVSGGRSSPRRSAGSSWTPTIGRRRRVAGCVPAACGPSGTVRRRGSPERFRRSAAGWQDS